MNVLRLGIAALTLTSAFALGASSATAADIYSKGTAGYKDQVEVVNDWAGFYIGGHVGGLFDDSDKNYGFRGASGKYSQQWADRRFNTRRGNNGDEVIGGLHLGFNVQKPGSAFVVGLESDFDFADRINFLSTVRGRVGVATPNALIYFTGGVAFIDYDNSFEVSKKGQGRRYSLSHTGDDYDVGYVLGGGVEFKPGTGFFGVGPSLGSNVSFGVEGLYYSFDGSDRYDVTRAGGESKTKTNVGYFGGDNELNFWQVRARVTYHVQADYQPLK